MNVRTYGHTSVRLDVSTYKRTCVRTAKQAGAVCPRPSCSSRVGRTCRLQASEYERSSRRRYLTFVATALSNARIRPYAKLQTTVYPRKSPAMPPKLRQNPFQTIPNKLFSGQQKILVGDCFWKKSDFSGLPPLQNAPKTIWNAPESSGNIPN